DPRAPNDPRRECLDRGARATAADHALRLADAGGRRQRGGHLEDRLHGSPPGIMRRFTVHTPAGAIHMSDHTTQFFVGLESRVWDALARGDADADRELLAEDFVGVYPTGFATRAEHVGELADGPT